MRIVREVQEALDRGGGDALAKGWGDALRQRPRDPRAQFGGATVARLRYQYERADSLYQVIAEQHARTPWHAAALVGRAQWRTITGEVARADSLFEEARRIAAVVAEPALGAEALLGLSSLRQRTQGPATGKALLAAWWAALPAPTFADSMQRLCGVGALDEQLGDTTGIRRIGEGTALAEQRGAWRLVGQCRLAYAQVTDRRGFPVAAVHHGRQAVAAFDRVHNAAGGALARQWLAYALLSRSAFAESRRTYGDALRLARQARYAAVEGWIHTGLAELHLRLGELGDARRNAAAAAASHMARNDQWGIAVSRRFEALARRASGDLRGAIARLEEAEAAFAAAGLPFNALSVVATRATLQMRGGQLDSAERTIATGDRLSRGSGAWPDEARILRAELAMRRGQLARADSLLRTTDPARKWRGGGTRLYDVEVAAREAQVAIRARNWPLADSALAAVTGTLEAWREQADMVSIAASLAQLRNTWGDLGSAWPDLVAALSQAGRVDQAFALVEQVRARQVVERVLLTAAVAEDSVTAARVVRRRLDAGGTSGAKAALATVQRTLATDEALVSYVLGTEGASSTVLLVTRERIRAFTAPGADMLAPDIERVLRLAAAGTDPTVPGRRLAAALLDSVVDALPAAVARLVVSPDGALHRVPFDALRLRDGRVMVERAAITIAPSATAWLALRDRAPAPTSRIVAVGDPTYRAVAATLPPGRGTGREPDAATHGWPPSNLARLPHSGVEATRVAGYGRSATVLRGPRATEAALRRLRWDDVAVLHVAAHALVDNESQQRTAVALTAGDGHDGLLMPDDIAQLDLPGSLVVLSACHSSGGLVLAGEGLRGLASPLLEAGASAVIATHWAIGDRSVVPFVDRVYAAMARGARVDDALREAKLSAIRDGASIADWAGFTVVGAGNHRPALRSASVPPLPWQRSAVQSRREATDSLPPP